MSANWWLIRATYVVNGRFFGHFFWKVEGSSAHTHESHTAHVHGTNVQGGGGIHVWKLLTFARGIHMWELLTCEKSHQSEILHSLIFSSASFPEPVLRRASECYSKQYLCHIILMDAISNIKIYFYCIFTVVNNTQGFLKACSHLTFEFYVDVDVDMSALNFNIRAMSMVMQTQTQRTPILYFLCPSILCIFN